MPKIQIMRSLNTKELTISTQTPSVSVTECELTAYSNDDK